MKFRLLVPILLLAFSVSAETVETTEKVSSREEALRQAAADRMSYLENLHGIKFDREELCSVTFAISENDNPSSGAKYIPSERALYMSPRFTLQFAAIWFKFGEHAFEGDPELNWDPELMTLLDHELGHAKADQTSRRIGNGVWPDLKTYPKLIWHKRYGIGILSEGIANFFGPIALESNQTKGEMNLPEKSDENYLFSDEAVDSYYDGGYWLVNEIFKHRRSASVEEVIEYLVTHPFDFPDGNARKAGKKYQKKALAELGKKRKK